MSPLASSKTPISHPLNNMPISPAFPRPTPTLLSNQDRPPACPFFMSTIKQIAANRLDALQFSGPRSVEGKAVSGLCAQSPSGTSARNTVANLKPIDPVWPVANAAKGALSRRAAIGARFSPPADLQWITADPLP